MLAAVATAAPTLVAEMLEYAEDAAVETLPHTDPQAEPTLAASGAREAEADPAVAEMPAPADAAAAPTLPQALAQAGAAAP